MKPRSTNFLPALHLALLAALPLSAAAQAAPFPNPQPPLRFEVASIYPQPSAGDQPSNRQMLPGGRFVATGTTVRTLLRMAFGIDTNRISGAPGWIDNETFAINATTAQPIDLLAPPQVRQLILSLLEDRFQLRFHREQKEAPIFWLLLDKPGRLGPALKPSTPASQPNVSTNTNGSKVTMRVARTSLTEVAAALGHQAGRPVEDHTGLQGSFDFQIQWALEQTPDSNLPSLFTALKEQLGLKLEPTRGATELLIIDQITHPSPN